MNIKVYGSGCPTCHKLFETTKQVVEELKLDTEVQYIDDIQKIIEMGLMQSPVLVIDDKPVLIGSIGNKNMIKELIQKELK